MFVVGNMSANTMVRPLVIYHRSTVLSFPDISDAAVIGVPDEKWGERLKAFLVTGAEIDAEAIAEWCDGKISAMKIPKDVAIIDVLPRNASGKVLKTDLRQL